MAVAAAAVSVMTLIGVAAVRADPAPSLPAVAPDRLAASALEALGRPFTISGDVTTRLDLGLPELPTGLGGGYGGPVSSLIGEQHFKVWRSPDGVRVAHMFDFTEQVLVANHREAWTWDSDGMSATRLRFADVRALLEARGAAWFDGGIPDRLPPAPSDADVVAAAGGALRALAPYADVTVDGTARVAGRPVYELVLTPRSELTTIGRVSLAIDAETDLPLRLQVIPKNSDEAAIESGFTSVSFAAIDPAMFEFTPPAGANVHEADPRGAAAAFRDVRADHPSPPATRVFGTGFETRLAVQLDGPLPDAATQLLPYAGPLVSATTAERGGHTWLLVGFVGLDTLQGDAQQLA